MRRFLPLLFILAAMAILYFSGAYRYFSFEALKVYHLEIKTFQIAHPVVVPVLYIFIYVLATALSVPGAIFLTLLGGYLFPQPFSTIYVVFSATCGATIIFLIARSALGDSLQKKAGPFLKKMRAGFEKNAANYMLFLRFVPLFPFWLVNVAPAFFKVPLRTYIWTTFVGIAPGSFVFTLAGGGLERIFDSNEPFSMATIFNFEMRIALTLLGLLALTPILIKKWRKSHD